MKWKLLVHKSTYSLLTRDVVRVWNFAIDIVQVCVTPANHILVREQDIVIASVANVISV